MPASKARFKPNRRAHPRRHSCETSVLKVLLVLYAGIALVTDGTCTESSCDARERSAQQAIDEYAFSPDHALRRGRVQLTGSSPRLDSDGVQIGEVGDQVSAP